jgi:two-component system response regulator FlrC
MNGRELLQRLRAVQPALPVLVMTAYGTIEQAVAAMRDGASDYIVKPFEADELERRVARYVQPTAATASTVATASTAGAASDERDESAESHRPDESDEPVAHDSRSRAMLELARRVAASDVTVLLSGESGTGKEVLARYIHARSKRSGGPFIAVNCAAIPEQMLEALLFGHENGAFTGAQSRSDGKFVQAPGSAAP